MFEHQYEKNGIYGGIDTRWPNGIIPFNYDETGVDPSGNRFGKIIFFNRNVFLITLNLFTLKKIKNGKPYKQKGLKRS